ncbi:MAG: DeoR/GlpR family DNA-binding transcription regulator [Actinobacteria bacterium]|nr:DeoR/GlpR family DNA-binding transcription regulator [Actinomycetota bacterium]
MLAEERREYILELLNKDGSLSVPEIAKMLKISDSTIRRDLNKLARDGQLRRTHGGALRLESVGLELIYDVQKELFVNEKRRIGTRAAKLIEDGDVVLIEAGTTGLELARNIDKNLNLTVITNGPDIAIALRKLGAKINVILTGGILRAETCSLIGPHAERLLEEVHVDKAFIGITGLTVEEGLTMANPLEAHLRKKMISSAKEVIAIGDNSKFGRVSMNFVASIEDLDIVVTDDKLSSDIKRSLEEKGVEVITC